MIIYKNILERLKSSGYTSYRLRKDNLLPQKTLTAIRNNEPINTKTIDTVCRLANCQPGDIMEYIPDENTSEE